MNNRFALVDRFASNDPWPYHILDELTGRRFGYSDERGLTEWEIERLNSGGLDGSDVLY